MNDNIIDWLNQELEKRDWGVTELGRRTGYSHTTFSMLLAGKINPSAKLCAALAVAFGVAPESVLRLAGHLPAIDTDQSELEALIAQWKLLSHEDRRTAYLMLKSLNEAREQRERA